MRLLILFAIIVGPMHCFAQYGYIRLENDSIVRGFIKPFRAFQNGEEGLQIWHEHRDEPPRKILKRHIQEYMINFDTVVVMHDFMPFPEFGVAFSTLDGKLLSRGKINLYSCANYFQPRTPWTRDANGNTGSQVYDKYKWVATKKFLYVLEDPEHGISAGLSTKKDKLYETPLNFFPERYLKKYIEVKGPIKYKSIPDLVKRFNKY